MYRIKVLWYYIECIWSRLIYQFGISYDKEVIPKGTPYCYELKPEKDGSFSTKNCKYYRFMEGYNAGCVYTGVIGYDLLLSDQCKICGENED